MTSALSGVHNSQEEKNIPELGYVLVDCLNGLIKHYVLAACYPELERLIEHWVTKTRGAKVKFFKIKSFLFCFL